MIDWLLGLAESASTDRALYVAYVLFDIGLIVWLARGLGNLLARLGQPRVVGEILAGILLGPTLLGESMSQIIVPLAVRPTISVLATLGLVLFMFIAGLEFDLSLIRGRVVQATILAVLSVVIPALVGFPIATVMHTSQFAGPAGSDLFPFALLIGAALTVTAFPVMAHILLERDELKTNMGGLAVASAGLISILMFLYIAFAGNVATSGGVSGLLLTIVNTILFCLVSWLIVRPLLARFVHIPVTTNQRALIFGGLFFYGLIADRIGIHALMGGFIWGMLFPAEAKLRRQLVDMVRDLALIVLLPLFFAAAGFAADLKLLSPAIIPVTLLLLVGAVASKFIGVVPAHFFGLSWQDIVLLGALFNTRGLLVLVVGLIGLQTAIITTATFTLFVVIALVTNLMTLPVMNVVSGKERI